MKIAIACDHGGVELKNQLIEMFTPRGYEFVNFGTDTAASVDYPIYAFKAAEAVASGAVPFGIVICSSGIGVSIAANKVAGIRCAHVTDPKSAEMTRRHNDANMLALGSKISGIWLAEEIVERFLTTEFEGGRHQRRIDLITDYENRNK